MYENCSLRLDFQYYVKHLCRCFVFAQYTINLHSPNKLGKLYSVSQLWGEGLLLDGPDLQFQSRRLAYLLLPDERR